MASRALPPALGGPAMGGPTMAGVAAANLRPLPGQRQRAQIQARQRLVIVMVMFVAVPFVMAARLFDLGVMEARPVNARAALSTAPPRADIVDRNGVELARTFEAYSLSVEPRKLASEPRQLARNIAAILTDKTEDDIYDQLTHRGTFRYIARRVLPSEAKRINDLGEPAINLGRRPSGSTPISTSPPILSATPATPARA